MLFSSHRSSSNSQLLRNHGLGAEVSSGQGVMSGLPGTSRDITPPLWGSACLFEKGEGEARRPPHFPLALMHCDLLRSEKQEGATTAKTWLCGADRGKGGSGRSTQTEPRQKQALNSGLQRPGLIPKGVKACVLQQWPATYLLRESWPQGNQGRWRLQRTSQLGQIRACAPGKPTLCFP